MMREPSDSDLLTLDQAAARVGLTDTRRRKRGATHRAIALQRAIEGRERQTGAEIMIRSGGPRRTKLRITLHALREHLPELFPGTRTRLAEEDVWRKTILAIRRRLNERYEPLEQRVTEAERRIDLSDAKIRELALEVFRIVDPEGSTPRPDDSDEKKSGLPGNDAENTARNSA